MAQRYENVINDYMGQGVLLANVVVPTASIAWGTPLNFEDGQEIALPMELVEHPYSIIVSPECDLYSDHAERQKPAEDQKRGSMIAEIIMCDVYTRDELRSANGINSDIWRRIKNNQHERFQLLAASTEEDKAAVDELVVDFQMVFGISVHLLRGLLSGGETQPVARLTETYRRQLIHRFTHWQGRVDLPE